MPDIKIIIPLGKTAPSQSGPGLSGAYRHGGMIPGKVNRATGDDTTIAAKKGEYVLPVEVVDHLGKDTLDAMVAKIKAMSGQDPIEHMHPDMGMATGGYVNPDEQAMQEQLKQLKAGLSQQQPPMVDEGQAALESMLRVQPGQKIGPQSDFGKAPAPVSNPGIGNLGGTIGTIDNGSSIKPVYDNNTLGAPMTTEQASYLTKPWDVMADANKPLGLQTTLMPGGGKMMTLGNPKDAPALVDNRSDADVAQNYVRQATNNATYNFADPKLQTGLMEKAMAEGAALGRQHGANQIASDKADAALSMATDRLNQAMQIAKMNNDTSTQNTLLRLAAKGNNISINMPTADESALILKGIQEGRIDPTKVNSRTAKIYAEMEKAGGSNTNYVGAAGNARYSTLPANLQSRALMEGIDPLYEKLLTAGKTLGNSSIPGVNRVVNWVKENTGNPDIVAFNNLRDDVIAESERALLGSGVLSDSKYMRAVKNVNSAQTFQQLNAAVKNLRMVINTRMDALNAKPFSTTTNNKPTTTGAATIVRTGTDASGRKVQQMSDGTIRYAN